MWGVCNIRKRLKQIKGEITEKLDWKIIEGKSKYKQLLIHFDDLAVLLYAVGF